MPMPPTILELLLENGRDAIRHTMLEAMHNAKAAGCQTRSELVHYVVGWMSAAAGLEKELSAALIELANNEPTGSEEVKNGKTNDT